MLLKIDRNLGSFTLTDDGEDLCTIIKTFHLIIFLHNCVNSQIVFLFALKITRKSC